MLLMFENKSDAHSQSVCSRLQRPLSSAETERPFQPSRPCAGDSARYAQDAPARPRERLRSWSAMRPRIAFIRTDVLLSHLQ